MPCLAAVLPNQENNSLGITVNQSAAPSLQSIHL